MAYNWHWVSSKGTNVKISIFGTYPVTRAKSIEKTIPNIFWRMTASNINIYLYFIDKTVEGHFKQNPQHFDIKTQFCIFVHSSFCHVFVTNTGLLHSRVWEYPQFKPKHMFIIIKYHNFLWMIKLVFGMFLKFECNT